MGERRQLSSEEIMRIAADRKAAEEKAHPLEKIDVTVDVDTDEQGQPVVRVVRHAEGEIGWSPGAPSTG